MKVFIETERLIIRDIELTDEDDFFEMDSNPNVHTYLGKNPVKSKEQARDIIKFIRQQYIDNGVGRLAIVEKSTNKFIGWTGLKLMKEKINDYINFYDMGYRLNENYWGKGFATETAVASLKYGFEKLNLTEIIGICDKDNRGSNHVLKKSGLKFINTFDFNGIDHNWYKITKDEWGNNQLTK